MHIYIYTPYTYTCMKYIHRHVIMLPGAAFRKRWTCSNFALIVVTLLLFMCVHDSSAQVRT